MPKGHPPERLKATLDPRDGSHCLFGSLGSAEMEGGGIGRGGACVFSPLTGLRCTSHFPKAVIISWRRNSNDPDS